MNRSPRASSPTSVGVLDIRAVPGQTHKERFVQLLLTRLRLRCARDNPEISNDFHSMFLYHSPIGSKRRVGICAEMLNGLVS